MDIASPVSTREPASLRDSNQAQDSSCASKTQKVALAIIVSVASFLFLPAPLPIIVSLISLTGIVYVLTRSSKEEEAPQENSPPSPIRSKSSVEINFSSPSGNRIISSRPSQGASSLSSHFPHERWLPTNNSGSHSSSSSSSSSSYSRSSGRNRGQDSIEPKAGAKKSPYEAQQQLSHPHNPYSCSLGKEGGAVFLEEPLSHRQVGAFPESLPPADFGRKERAGSISISYSSNSSERAPSPSALFMNPFENSFPDIHRQVGTSAPSENSSPPKSERPSNRILPSMGAKQSPHDAAPRPPLSLSVQPRLTAVSNPRETVMRPPSIVGHRHVGEQASAANPPVPDAKPSVGTKLNPHDRISHGQSNSAAPTATFLPTQSTQRIPAPPKSSLATSNRLPTPSSSVKPGDGRKASPYENASLADPMNARSRPVLTASPVLPSQNAPSHRSVGGTPSSSQVPSGVPRRQVGGGN